MTTTTRVPVRRSVDRPVVFASLGAVTVIAWSVALQVAAAMRMPGGMTVTSPSVTLVMAMWVAMMVGMMVPSASPMVLAFAGWTRRDANEGGRVTRVAAFVCGYVLVWSFFSVFAATVQVVLDRVDVLSAMGVISRPVVGGSVLVAAGAFQVSPWKGSCLARCRSPIGFLVAEWRPGAGGAVLMGARHGLYCLGCCWMLMAVLFVVGTMHVVWMAILGGFVLAEKVAPRLWQVDRVGAILLVGWGTWALVTELPW